MLTGRTLCEPRRATPVLGACGMVVLGGGLAAIMAASAAARAGTGTLLVAGTGCASMTCSGQ